ALRGARLGVGLRGAQILLDRVALAPEARVGIAQREGDLRGLGGARVVAEEDLEEARLEHAAAERRCRLGIEPLRLGGQLAALARQGGEQAGARTDLSHLVHLALIGLDELAVVALELRTGQLALALGVEKLETDAVRGRSARPRRERLALDQGPLAQL